MVTRSERRWRQARIVSLLCAAAILFNTGCLWRRVVTEGVAFTALELLFDSNAVLDLFPDSAP